MWSCPAASPIQRRAVLSPKRPAAAPMQVSWWLAILAPPLARGPSLVTAWAVASHRLSSSATRQTTASLAAAAAAASGSFPAESAAQPSTPSFTVLFDSTNHWHRDLQYHPEQPRRISACLDAIDEIRCTRCQQHDNGDGSNDSRSTENFLDLVELVDVAPPDAYNPNKPLEGSSRVLSHVVHRPFSDSELRRARDALVHVHGEELVQQLEERCQQARQRRLDDGKLALGHLGHIDYDTYLTTESFGVSLRAAASWIRAADAAAAALHRSSSEGHRPAGAMALVRPPGHHATARSQNGFCLYNFAAAAAWDAVSRHKDDRRVSILDWDVHYGQGVADIVQHFDQVRYVSIHQTPAFPYMGETLEVTGALGNVLTIPIPASTTWSTGYKEAFDRALDFCCRAGEWEPDLVIVSAGFDALDSDELASVSLQASDFGRMARALRRHLDANLKDRAPSVVLGLEGGYQLSENAVGGNLPQAVVETIRALVDEEARHTRGRVASPFAGEKTT